MQPSNRIFFKLIVSGVVLGLLFGSAAGVVRLKEPSGTTIGYFEGVKYIVGSNGESYTVTNANLQTLINNLDGDSTGLSFWNGGKITVGDDITITSTIRLKNNTEIDFQNHVITVADNVDLFNISGNTGHCTIKNAVINITDAGYTSTLISLYATGAQRCDFNSFENIRVNPDGVDASAKYNFNGIKLHLDSCSKQIWQNTFRDITLWYVDHGIWLRASGTGGLGYQNTFEDIMIWHWISGMIFFDTDTAVTDAFYRNSFYNVKGESYTGSLHGVYNISDSSNYFFDCHVWDWHISVDPFSPSWSIAGNGSNPAVYTTIDFAGSIVDYVADGGLYTSIRSSVFGNRNLDLNNSMFSPVRTSNRDLLLNLPMGEGSGESVYGDGRYAIDGEVVGGASWVDTGNYGYVLDFDNATHYVELDSNPVLDKTDNISFCWWMKWDGVESGSTDYIYASSDALAEGITIRIGSSGTFNLRITDNGNQMVIAGGVGNLTYSGIYGEWAHISIVYDDPLHAYMYINGRVFDTTITITNTGVAVNDFDTPTIGALSGGASGFFDGMIRDFHIYNRPLSQDECRSDWLLGLNRERDLGGYLIETSKGAFYPPTQSGLQQAIYNLNNETGCVDGANQNISISSTVYLTSNLTLKNVHLYLANNANVTMLRNYGGRTWTTEASVFSYNTNIKISDVTIDGNGDNQPHWYSTGDRPRLIYGILFRGINNSSLDNVKVINADCGGIVFSQGNNCSVSNCIINDVGKGYAGTRKTVWWSQGIMFDNMSFSSIEKTRVSDCYANGITLESKDTAENAWLSNSIISDCFVSDCEVGIYIEHTKFSTISGCHVSDCNKWEVYQTPVGIGLMNPNRDNLIENCVVTRCGNITGSQGTNYYISGWDNTVTDCRSAYGYEHGYSLWGKNNTLLDSQAYLCSNGTYSNSYNTTIRGCTFTASKNYGVYFTSTPSVNYYSQVTDCKIINSSNAGIYGLNYNSSFTDNYIYGGIDGIRILGNFNIVANNRIAYCSDDGIEVNGVQYYTAQNNSILGNIITNCGDGGIILGTYAAKNNSVASNIITNCVNGIKETSASYSQNNNILGNVIRGCTTPITKVGINTIVRNNIGFVTENWGTATVLANTVTIVVSHGLATTPTCVIVVPYENLSRVAGGDVATYWVDTLGATQFTIHISDSFAATKSFYWYAKV